MGRALSLFCQSGIGSSFLQEREQGRRGRPGPGRDHLGRGPGSLSQRRLMMGGIQGPGPREAEHAPHP